MESHRKQTKSYEDKVIKFLEESIPQKRGIFTDFQIETIKKYYATRPYRVIAKALGFSTAQITNKVNKLGLKKGQKH